MNNEKVGVDFIAPSMTYLYSSEVFMSLIFLRGLWFFVGWSLELSYCLKASSERIFRLGKKLHFLNSNIATNLRVHEDLWF